MSDAVCLNVGCGPLRIPGEIGVDRYPTAAVDVIADLMALPWSAGSVDQVRLDHVLEHMDGRLAVPALLEAQRVLRPGGSIRVGVPDLGATCRAYAEAESLADRALILRWLYGSQAHEGEYHKSGWDPMTLADLLTCVGFDQVSVREDAERDEGICIVAEAVRA